MPPSCAGCLEILRASTSWRPKGLARLVQGELYLICVCMMGLTKGKRQLGRPRREWNDTVKMGHEEMAWEGVDWVNVAACRDIWKVVVSRAM